MILSMGTLSVNGLSGFVKSNFNNSSIHFCFFCLLLLVYFSTGQTLCSLKEITG